MLTLSCIANSMPEADAQTEQTVAPVPTPSPEPKAEQTAVHNETEDPGTPTPTLTPAPTPTLTPEPKRITAAMLDEGLYDSYFDDALFIGDSLTFALSNYVRSQRTKKEDFLGKAQFMGTVSMSVKVASTNTAYSVGISFQYRGKPISLTDGIKATEAKKAFIMLGLNDVGNRNWDNVKEYFATMIEIIQAECPDTKIVIFGILPVTEHYCKEYNLNISHWNSFNEILAGICEAHDVTFLNFADEMMDDSGYLKLEYANGDFHLKESGNDVWIRAARAFAATELYPDAILDLSQESDE